MTLWKDFWTNPLFDHLRWNIYDRDIYFTQSIYYMDIRKRNQIYATQNKYQQNKYISPDINQQIRYQGNRQAKRHQMNVEFRKTFIDKFRSRQNN